MKITRTVIAEQFDGSAEIPAKYWLTLNQAIHFFGYDSNEFKGSKWEKYSQLYKKVEPIATLVYQEGGYLNW